MGRKSQISVRKISVFPPMKKVMIHVSSFFLFYFCCTSVSFLLVHSGESCLQMSLLTEWLFWKDLGSSVCYGSCLYSVLEYTIHVSLVFGNGMFKAYAVYFRYVCLSLYPHQTTGGIPRIVSESLKSVFRDRSLGRRQLRVRDFCAKQTVTSSLHEDRQ